MSIGSIISLYESFNLDWPNATLGGLMGLGLVCLIDFLRKPKIKFNGFQKIKVNFGTLYKIKVKIFGHINPGLSAASIKWKDGSVYAKWDETPNPLKNDQLSNFTPEMVPQTFYQNTFCGKSYLLPILHEDENKKITVFSGWWFGRDKGYDASVPELMDTSEIQIEFLSQNVNKRSKKYSVAYIKDSIINNKNKWSKIFNKN